MAAMARYKRCPSDKIKVVYGKVGKGKTSQCIHGGAAFIWPLIQDYRFLDLQPMTIDINLENALSKQNIRVSIPSRFTIGISTEPDIMTVAAERLLSMERREIEINANEIIFGQLRATIATMVIEEINANRDVFEQKIMDNVEGELKKIGLKLINVNIKDINDESGYIVALGKKAAAEALNKAKVEVAEQDRTGATGEANAKQEERVNVASADAKAVEGENMALVTVANSDAIRRKGDAATLIKKAAADQAGYDANKMAEDARANMNRSTQTADIVVPAQIEKEKVVIEAQAEREQTVLDGKGKGEAIQVTLEGEANGIKAILERKAEGFERIVSAAGGDPDKAAVLMIVEQLPKIAELQAQAISKIHFDKIVVMDGGGNGNGNGTTTSNWLSNITKVLPGLHEFANMAGIKLPDALGEQLKKPDVSPTPPESSPASESK
jgi:flotillin